MPFNQIVDGYIYLVLMHEHQHPIAIYNTYAEYLSKKGISIDNFLFIINAGNAAKMASEEMKQYILKNLTFIPSDLRIEASTNS